MVRLGSQSSKLSDFFGYVAAVVVVTVSYLDERLSGGRGGLLPHPGRPRVSQSYPPLHPAVGAPLPRIPLFHPSCVIEMPFIASQAAPPPPQVKQCNRSHCCLYPPLGLGYLFPNTRTFALDYWLEGGAFTRSD